MGKKKHKNRKAHHPHPQVTPAVAQPTRKNIIEEYSIVVAVLICIISFFVHIYGADFEHRERITSVDESVYSRLGLQLKEGNAYNTIDMYNQTLRAGKKLPPYFKEPLFKHPPFYSFLISLSYTSLKKKPNYSFDELYAHSSKVSNIMGCLLIGIVFLFGKMLYDYRVGLIASFILAIDLNLLNCSQKVWMESTLAAMIWLALYLLYKGFDQKWYLLLGGIAAGLALLTKYPAGILFIIFIGFALIFERQVFKSALFYVSLFLTGLVFLPWILMNYDVYGAKSLSEGKIGNWSISRFEEFIGIVGIFVLFFIVTRLIKWKRPSLYQKYKEQQSKLKYVVTALLVLFFGYLLLQGDFRATIVSSLSWNGFPKTGWDMISFVGQPRYFYLKQVLLYSPLYLFFYAGALKAPLETKEDAFLLIAASLPLILMSFFDNYQGRYILYFAPAAALLGAKVITQIYDYLLREKSIARIALTVLFSLVLVYFVAKTIRVDLFHAMNNNVAYY